MSEGPNVRARRALEAASLLVEGGFYADAASRVYYAAFYVARDAVRQAGQETHTHKGVHVSFNRLFVQTGRISKDVGHMLRELFRARMDADYDDGDTITKEQALEALGLAHQFVTHIEALLDD